MKLFVSPGACSMSCHIASEEGKIAVTPVISDWDAVAKLNPMGAVPVLQTDDGKVVTQNIAILSHFAALAPSLLPKAGTFEHAQTMQWLAWTSSDLHPTCGELFAEDLSPEATKAAEDATHNLLSIADKHMAGRKFIAGDQFTIADCLFFTVYSWMPMLELKTDQYANLNSYKSRIAERPAVMSVMKREGLLK